MTIVKDYLCIESDGLMTHHPSHFAAIDYLREFYPELDWTCEGGLTRVYRDGDAIDSEHALPVATVRLTEYEEE